MGNVHPDLPEMTPNKIKEFNRALTRTQQLADHLMSQLSPSDRAGVLKMINETSMN